MNVIFFDVFLYLIITVIYLLIFTVAFTFFNQQMHHFVVAAWETPCHGLQADSPSWQGDKDGSNKLSSFNASLWTQSLCPELTPEDGLILWVYLWRWDGRTVFLNLQFTTSVWFEKTFCKILQTTTCKKTELKSFSTCSLTLFLLVLQGNCARFADEKAWLFILRAKLNYL